MNHAAGGEPNRISENLRRVQARLAAAALSAGRSPEQVRLIVVTKGHPLAAVQAVIAAGGRELGENYVEEGVQKKLAASAQDGVKWHMIGHVQSRKAELVAQHFDWVHSVDNLKLAARLNRFAGEHGRKLPVLLECNVSGEQTKFGWPAWEESAWPALLPDLEQLLALPHLEVRGLMTMAPYAEEAEPARPFFQKLRRFQGFLAGRWPQTDWQELSMGMSGDFEVAIQEGATMVRIGTAILGPRPPAG